MQFNFTATKEIGAVRTRAKRIVIGDNKIIYDLENRIFMKDKSVKFYELGQLTADLTIDKDINCVDIDTGEVKGSKNLLLLAEEMKTRAGIILKGYTYKDFTVTTEVGTSYFEVKDIVIDNIYDSSPSVNFRFNEVLNLADNKIMKMEKDQLYISLQVDITKTKLVDAFLQLNQNIFDIMVDAASNPTVA